MIYQETVTRNRSKIVSYVMLEENSADSLSEKVTEYLNTTHKMSNGKEREWELYGDPFWGSGALCQALVLREYWEELVNKEDAPAKLTIKYDG